MNAVKSHLSPQFYLNRWINPLLVPKWKKAVLIHPCSKYSIIWTKSTDSDFFKENNYFATLNEWWKLSNENEQLLSESYESYFWKFIDKLLLNIENIVSEWWGCIELDDQEVEWLYQFLAYTYFRTPYWEIYWLTKMNLALQDCWSLKSGDLASFCLDFDWLIKSKWDKTVIDKTIFNDLFIKWVYKNEILSDFKNMEIIFWYAKNCSTKYITSDHIFSMMTFWNTSLEQEYLISLDPNLCIFIWWKRQDQKISMKVYVQSDDQVKAVNNAIFYWPISADRLKYIISYSKEEIERLIALRWPILRNEWPIVRHNK